MSHDLNQADKNAFKSDKKTKLCYFNEGKQLQSHEALQLFI